MEVQQDDVRRVLDGALDAVIGADDDGRVTGWNAEASRLLGWPANEVLGRPLDELVLPAGGWAAFRAAAGTRRELELRDRDGRPVLVEAAIAEVELSGGPVVLAWLRDRREELTLDRLREAEHEVARIVAASPVGSDPVPQVLEVLCTTLGWRLGEWWEREADVLVRTACHGDGALNFCAAGERVGFSRGHGLVGLAWEAGAVTAGDLSELDGPRREAARADGVRCGIAVPVVVDGEVGGALALFSDDPAPMPTHDAEALLEDAATTLGQFGHRRRLERAQADETQMLAAVTSAVRRLSSSHERDAARKAICEAAFDACEATVAFLAEPDEERGGLVISAFTGIDMPPGEPVLLPWDGPSAAVEAHRSGVAAFLPDIPSMASADQANAAAHGLLSGYVQPVTRGSAKLGVLGVAWARRIPRLAARLEALMALLADEAAIALDRATMVSDLMAAARTDPLTGLRNLRGWDEALDHELAAAARDGRPVAVAVADLDGFKAFNDAHGHQAGDRLLRETVAGWQAALRAADIVARIGGDEFGVLLPSCDPPGGAALAERLRAAMPSGHTCSVGVAAWDREEVPHALVARADAALYAAKAAGRDRVVVA